MSHYEMYLDMQAAGINTTKAEAQIAQWTIDGV
jgi:hypothetical protein